MGDNFDHTVLKKGSGIIKYSIESILGGVDLSNTNFRNPAVFSIEAWSTLIFKIMIIKSNFLFKSTLHCNYGITPLISKTVNECIQSLVACRHPNMI